MARVIYSDVTSIIDTDLCREDVETMIDVASVMVADRLSSSGLSENILKEIERYLTAHLIQIREPEVSSVRIGPMATTYNSSDTSGKGFSSTRYGQMAIMLDTSGTLSEASTVTNASLTVFSESDAS